MDNYCVYRHTCPNGKTYIGITKQNPLQRWRHGFGYRSNAHFYRAIIRYGWDNITHEILYSGLSKEEAAQMEIVLIKKHRSCEKEYGYNNTSGGFSFIPNKDIRDNMSRNMREQYANGKRSRHRSEEANRRTSETLKSRFSNGEITRIILPDQRKKLSEKKRGKKLSEEHKAKVRASSHKKAVQQCVGDNIIAVYKGVREAGRQTGIDYTSIIKVLKGRKHTAGGYAWRYTQ